MNLFTKRIERTTRVRKKTRNSATRPRLTVFRSSKHIWAQVIDDQKGITLASASDKKLKGTKTEKAKEVGTLVAEAALAKGIKEVYFDRGGYRYHGRVKALAEGSREKGLKF